MELTTSRYDMQLKHDEKITDVPRRLRTGVPWLRQRHVLRKFVDAITAAHASDSCVQNSQTWPLLYVFSSYWFIDWTFDSQSTNSYDLCVLIAKAIKSSRVALMIPRLNTGSRIFLDTDRKSHSWNCYPAVRTVIRGVLAMRFQNSCPTWLYVIVDNLSTS